jgi:murein DD-endopeptidase MepM/ murein hydrolase activator NlpD
LQTLHDNRKKELGQKQKLANENSAEQNRLEQKKRDRQQLVTHISQNKSALEAAIQEKKKSYQQLVNLISSLEREREQGERKLEPQAQIEWDKIKGNFADQRRNLNWPIRGEVLHPFGQYQNPKLKTTLVNNGIDIKVQKGEDIRCVFSGVVSLITYMGGFGNTVILDHNNGYYTVYAHLEEVLVKKFQILESGAIIGTAGDSGSLEGAKLHFEIYANNKPQNPIEWLKKL